MIKLKDLLEKYDYEYSSACDYQFAYTCVSPRDLGELEWIIDNMEEIRWNEFKRNVGKRELEASGLLEPYKDSNLSIDKDYAVSFYKAEGCYEEKLEYIDAYIVVHSAVEHVFLNNKQQYCD